MSVQTPPGRGTGQTTEQLKAAPQGAVFVWCNGNISYPRELAHKLNRLDIYVVPLSYALEERFRGQPRKIIVDHCAELPRRTSDAVQLHNTYLERRVSV